MVSVIAGRRRCSAYGCNSGGDDGDGGGSTAEDGSFVNMDESWWQKNKPKPKTKKGFAIALSWVSSHHPSVGRGRIGRAHCCIARGIEGSGPTFTLTLVLNLLFIPCLTLFSFFFFFFVTCLPFVCFLFFTKHGM